VVGGSSFFQVRQLCRAPELVSGFFKEALLTRSTHGTIPDGT